MKDNLRKYAEISCRNVEWDCLDVVPELMVSWLSVPGVLQSLAKHWSSGELLSPAQVSNIQEAKVHLAGYDLCQELYKAAYDLAFYSEDYEAEQVSCHFQTFKVTLESPMHNGKVH